MRIKEVMTEDVRTIEPDATLQEAARTLAEIDAGLLPVAESERLIGVLTDRDIVIRGVAEGCGPDTQVRRVLTAEVRYCFDDDSVDDVADNMAQLQVRRLPVVNRDKRLVGIVSLADLAGAGEHGMTGKALQGVTRPGGMHN